MTTERKRTGHRAQAGVEELSPEEWMALVDRQARRYLNMSGKEFIRAYRDGEIDVDGPQHLEIMRVAMLLPADLINPPDGG
jgi:hypothetical protein